MKISFKIILLISLLILSLKGFSQAPNLSEKAKVSILTCGSGEELHSIFGHTGVRIYDPINQIDTVFNYGTFDFDTSFFYLKFMYGNLEYYLSKSNYEDFVYHYQISNRSVFEQELALEPDVKQNIFNQLTKEINSEEKFYTYKFIDQNCTTKVVDLLTQFIPTNNIKASYNNLDELSYRGIINSYLSDKYFQKLGINLLFGLKTDKISDKIFLPSDLLGSITIAETNAKELSKETNTIYLRSDETEKINWVNNIFILLILFAIIILLKKQKLDIIFLKIIASLGVFMLLFSLISKHQEVQMNINILLFNPILFVLAYFYNKNNEKLFKRTTWILVLFALIFIFLTFNTSSFYIIIPFLVPLVIIVYRLPFYKTKMDDNEMIKYVIDK